MRLTSFLLIPVIVVTLLAESYLREEQVKQDYRRLDSNSPTEERQAVESLVAGCQEIRTRPRLPLFIGERVFGNCRSLFQAPLEGANLSGADLSDANLSDANLSGANLSRVVLNAADLNAADLSGANLSGANLSRAVLSGVTLTDADLSRADLRSAYFSRAVLRSANLSGANLNDANLRRAYLIDADLSKADLDGASLNGADLSGARNWIEAQLSSAKLCRTTLPQGTNLDPNRDCEELGIPVP